MRITNTKEGGVIEELIAAMFGFLGALLQPDILAVLTIVGGAGYKGFKSLVKKMDAQQNELIKQLDLRLKTLESSSKDNHTVLEREILRLQILNGIDARRLSYSEVSFFFDKYKELGGNSFVEDKVHMYISELQKQQTNFKEDE